MWSIHQQRRNNIQLRKKNLQNLFKNTNHNKNIRLISTHFYHKTTRLQGSRTSRNNQHARGGIDKKNTKEKRLLTPTKKRNIYKPLNLSLLDKDYKTDRGGKKMNQEKTLKEINEGIWAIASEICELNKTLKKQKK
jgi:hypothetical protein